MKIRIIKGTNQIGGCITEVSTGNSKIIIDFGSDLDSDDGLKVDDFELKGLTKDESTYDAVFITHGHKDHIGLIGNVNKDIPVYVEEKTRRVFEITNDFTNQENTDLNTLSFKFNKKIYIKDLIITPYRVDHSCPNSAMFLMEADGKRLLHMGDFRIHGRKGREFIENLNKIGKVDCLITEGTCFSRNNIKNKDEKEIERLATESFKKYNQVFILQSSTNIDRLVSFYKASVKTKKKFVEDLFTATIASNLSPNVANPINFDNVSVWVPSIYCKKSLKFKEKYVKPMEQYKNSFSLHGDYTMIVKSSMLDDVKLLKEKGLIRNGCLVYSMWNGYKEDRSTMAFLDNIKNLGIDICDLHTSGHADRDAIRQVIDIVNPDKIIPIHTTNKEEITSLTDNFYIAKDNEEFEI